MNDLYRALGDISSMRKVVASTTEFRGYGPSTLAVTGVFAVVAALVQALWIPQPANHLKAYLAIWLVTGVVSLSLTGWHMLTRTRRIHSELSNEMIRMAVEQFLPSLGAGALLTIVLELYVPQIVWMLPGMWQIIFSLGVFSSCRFLPKPMAAAGFWYLSTGLACIALGDNRALSPWTMGFAFGAGQLLVAAILLLRTTEAEDVQ